MKSETWIFVACTVFLLLVTPAYALVTDASEHGLDWTGTSALTMATLLTAMVSLYLGFHAKRMDPRPEDRKDGDIALAEYHQARMTPRELRRMLVPAYRLVNPATAGEMDNKFDPFAQGWAEQTVYVAQPVAQRQ